MKLTYLDLSSSHISGPTFDLVYTLSISISPGARNRRGWPAMTIARYEYGIFITVPDEGYDDQAIPTDLEQLFYFARMHRIGLIRLDADGPTTEDLPTYDW